jgi:uncharacterized protein (DUF849 family)
MGDELAHAQDVLAKYRETLSIRQAAQRNLNFQLTAVIVRKNELSTRLTPLQKHQDDIAVMNEQLKKIITHVNNIFTASTVFLDTLKNLVKFNSLIKPLNAINRRLKHTGIRTNVSASECFFSSFIEN